MKKIALSLLTFIYCTSQSTAQVEAVKTLPASKFFGVQALQNGRIIFESRGASGTETQLWSTDGTSGGTIQLTDLCNTGGFSSSLDSWSNGFYSDGNYYYGIISTDCNPQTIRIFKTDGVTISYSNETMSSLGLLQMSWLSNSFEVNNKMVLLGGKESILLVDKNTLAITKVHSVPTTVANDDLHYIGKQGDDLLFYTYNGGKLCKFDVNTNTMDYYFNIRQHYQLVSGAQPSYGVTSDPYNNYTSSNYYWNGYTYFWVYENSNNHVNRALWKTDGTATGTIELKHFPINNTNADLGVFFTPLNGQLYFRWAHSDTSALWKTDGTPAGTQMVKSFKTSIGASMSDLSNIIILNNKLLFTASRNGCLELHSSDGTTAGTQLISKFLPFSCIMDNLNALTFIQKSGNRAYFKSDWPDNIISTDGTIEGTYSIGSPLSASISSGLLLTDSEIYFTATTYPDQTPKLSKVNIQNERPYFISANNHGVEPGQTMTITGFDLTGGSRIYLFNHDNENYEILESFTQVNDTTVSFILPSDINLTLEADSFKVAFITQHGMFLSKKTFKTSSTAINEINPEGLGNVIQTKDWVLIDLKDKNKRYDIQLFDLTGKLLSSSASIHQDQYKLDKRKLVQGMYLLRINGSFAAKVVVW